MDPRLDLTMGLDASVHTTHIQSYKPVMFSVHPVYYMRFARKDKPLFIQHCHACPQPRVVVLYEQRLVSVTTDQGN